MTNTELDEKKKRFIKKIYFGTADNPLDDVNPFQTWEEFLSAKVKDMSWGIDPDRIKRSKIRFSYNFNLVLNHYNVDLALEEILTELEHDTKTNEELINIWVEKAVFNKM